MSGIKTRLYGIVVVVAISLSQPTYAFNQWYDFGLGYEVNEFMHGEGSGIKDDGTYTIDEYKLKALYVHYLLASSRWDGSLKKQANLCMVGQSDLALRMKKLASLIKPFYFWNILEGVRIADIKWKCDAVFIGHIYWHPELIGYLNAIKRTSKHRPILVIGDDKHLLKNGGMVVFYTNEKNAKLYLDVDHQEIEEASITLHWEILQIARSHRNILVAQR